MSEPGQTPVAWARIAENGNIQLWSADPKRALHAEMNGVALTPLYAHPSVMHGKLEDALRAVRSEFKVERGSDGHIHGIRHASDALPRVVELIDTALAELEKSQ